MCDGKTDRGWHSVIRGCFVQGIGSQSTLLGQVDELIMMDSVVVVGLNNRE